MDRQTIVVCILVSFGQGSASAVPATPAFAAAVQISF